MTGEMRNPTARDCSLPPELEFIIIDQLFSDKPTLASCSLVCSRWLPISRRHLFQDITVKPALRLDPDPFAHLLRTLQDSGGRNIEWAVGPCITKITFDGSAWDARAALTCPLNVLCTLLCRLPRLASLTVKKLVVLDEPSEDSHSEQGEISRFKLDELVVNDCSVRSHDNPRYLLALLSRFSAIRSLTVDSWWVWDPNAPPTFTLDTFSPPTIDSLTLKWIRPVCARALYAFLSASISPLDGSLTRISFVGGSPQDFAALSEFARISGPTIRDVKLRVLPDLPGPLGMFEELSLETCTALHSLALCVQPLFDDTPSSLLWHADDTREAFRSLTNVRLDIRPEGSEMLAAFGRVARDTYREWHNGEVQAVSVEEAERNRGLWMALENALYGLPALERVEFVLYERPKYNEILTEEKKAQLGNALEARLPRLWPSGAVRLMFEDFVYPYD